MAKLITSTITILFITFLAASSVQATEHAENQWFQNICSGSEKTAKVHFFTQDPLTGANASALEVARATITSSSSSKFGKVNVLDDLLTAGPDINSEVVGRLQGFITWADFDISAVAMSINIYFTSGDYNGSTIAIVGRNQLWDEERELAIVGGTGVFRYARGYAKTSTYSFNAEAQYGILEYMLNVAYGKPALACEHLTALQ